MAKIDLAKTVFTAEETKFIIDKLRHAAKEGYILSTTEPNPYLLASFAGMEGKGISPKWNVKIYTYNKKKKGHSLVCVDKHILGTILEQNYAGFTPPDLKVLRIDDAGWGFPLCGVMVGVSDEHDVQTGVVPVEYFRDDTDNNFQTKRYLEKYSERALELLKQFGASPNTHRIEICTGYINQPLREKLRGLGYDVRVVEVSGILQDNLEKIYREYIIAETGSDIYYDPKEIKRSDIPRKYQQTIEYGKKHCPHKMKSGWNAKN
jgi:hypothetical protein